MSKTLTIRYTSDTHGYLYPTSYADMQDRPMGLMKLASEYPHDGNTLIIDGGDTIQGSPLTNLYQRLSPEEKAACPSRLTPCISWKTACASVWSAYVRTSSAAGRTPKRSSSSSSKNLCPPPKPRWKP